MWLLVLKGKTVYQNQRSLSTALKDYKAFVWRNHPFENRFFKKKRFIYFREKEREEGWEGQRKREREKILSRPHAENEAVYRAQSHNPEIMTWAKTKSEMLNQLSQPRCLIILSRQEFKLYLPGSKKIQGHTCAHHCPQLWASASQETQACPSSSHFLALRAASCAHNCLLS